MSTVGVAYAYCFPLFKSGVELTQHQSGVASSLRQCATVSLYHNHPGCTDAPNGQLAFLLHEQCSLQQRQTANHVGPDQYCMFVALRALRHVNPHDTHIPVYIYDNIYTYTQTLTV